jgi:hypothetical protein
MNIQDLQLMLARMGGIRHPCDLDLLLFFHRHPLALLTSEQLVAYLGYDRERVAKSLDSLIEAGHLARSQNPSRAARLYALEAGALPGGLRSSFLKIAATREGRQELIRLLKSAPDAAPAAARGRRSASITRVA